MSLFSRDKAGPSGKKESEYERAARLGSELAARIMAEDPRWLEKLDEIETAKERIKDDEWDALTEEQQKRRIEFGRFPSIFENEYADERTTVFIKRMFPAYFSGFEIEAGQQAAHKLYSVHYRRRLDERCDEYKRKRLEQHEAEFAKYIQGARK